MIDIANERLELSIGFQTSGGPGWQTEIFQLASGAEARNALWARPLRKWKVTGVALSHADLQAISRFFNGRSGAAQGFRFRDPFGWKSCSADASPSAFDQHIGTGDGIQTVFQLVLDDGAGTPQIITRPVGASVVVALDGLGTTGCSVNDETGEVMFAEAPANGVAITAGFEFDVPVRFDTDQLNISQNTNGAFQLTQLSLVELREVS